MQYFLGINYNQCQSLIEEKLASQKLVVEKQIRVKETKKFCPFIDCNSLQAKEWCSEKCVGSKNYQEMKIEKKITGKNSSSS